MKPLEASLNVLNYIESHRGPATDNPQTNLYPPQTDSAIIIIYVDL